ncbi:MAG: alkaline phosphatase [Thermoanaerobaculia bacterium]
MMPPRLRFVCLAAFVAAALAAVSPLAAQSGITVRVIPPHQAQFLRLQKFDVRVEATASDSAAVIDSLTVKIDGKDITAQGVVDTPSPNVRNWTYRSAQLGIVGLRNLAASATGTLSGTPLYGYGSNTLTVRDWPTELGAVHTEAPAAWSLDDLALRAAVNPSGGDSELHLGAISPAFHKRAEAGQRRAKNVILLIGDGMGIAHRTAGRILSKGYTRGKANGTMAMDRLPFNGFLMTSSLNSLITDSAPGAHNYSTGNKTNNGMEGVFPDNTAADDDNPRIENLSEWLTRNFGKVTGIVSDAFITDATPAAFLAHTQNRGNGTLIASQYIDEAGDTSLKVLLGGGSYHFIPKSQTGSRRTDERNVIADFQSAGFAYVQTATELNAYTAGADAKLLGLFNLDNMNVAYDKLGLGDPSVTAAFPDQPFLKDMAAKAIEVLRQYPNGFFLMVEGAHIDKQAHRMDAERSIYDVIQFDQAVQVALDFAIATNTDNDPDNDTLVIVSADHECSGMSIPGVARPEKKGTRDYVKTYNYGAPRNDSTVFNFTDYVDANGDGYPDNPAPPHKLIVNFGASSDHYEDWQPNARPKDPGVTKDGVAIANPNDPKAATGILVSGVIENGSAGGDVETQAVHTPVDIPISAYGPGASQFARVTDNTEAFFSIVNSMLGTYPIPTQF